MTTWGKRNHNPGCILGKSYATDYDGYLALIRTLQKPIYANCTAYEIFSTYAPAGHGDNNPAAYATHVINWLNNANHNIGWDTVLDLKDPNLLKDLLPAISKMECGEVLSGEETAQLAVNDWASGKVDLGPGRGPNDVVERVYVDHAQSAGASGLLAQATEPQKISYLAGIYYNSVRKLGLLNEKTTPMRYKQYEAGIINPNNVPHTTDPYTNNSLKAIAKVSDFIQKNGNEDPSVLSEKVFALIGKQMAPHLLNKDERCFATIAKITYSALCELHQARLGRGLTPKELETIEKNTIVLMENADFTTHPKAFLAHCNSVLYPPVQNSRTLADATKAGAAVRLANGGKSSAIHTLSGHANSAANISAESGNTLNNNTFNKNHIG